MNNYFWIFLVISFFKTTYGSDCNKFEAYNDYESAKNNGIIAEFKQNDKHLGKARDQDSIGYCYTYNASDMLDVWLKSKNKIPQNESVSALGMGLVDKENEWLKKHQEFLSMGVAKAALEPQLKKLKESISRIEKKKEKVDNKLSSITDEYRAKHPSYNEFKELEKDLDKEGSLRGKDQSNLSEDEFYNLMDKFNNLGMQIDDDVTIDPDYLSENKKLLKEKRQINKELEDLKTTIGQIEMNINPSSDIPDGGTAKEAIDNSFHRLCFESEVNSSDLGIQEIYNEYRDVFSSMTFQPKNLEEVLGAIVESQTKENKIICTSFYLVRNLFPKSPFLTESEYLKFVKKLNSGDNIFSELMEKICSKKRFTEIPKVEEKYLDPRKEKINEEFSSEAFELIDNALNSGQIAGIGYRSELLKSHSIEDGIKDFHASSIIGSMNICGEKYYTLRNSWGKKSCQLNQREYWPQEDVVDIDQEMEEKYKACINPWQQAASSRFEKCTTDECKIESKRFLSDQIEACRRVAYTNRDKLINHPYFCDKDGNWIISKEHLKKGVYRATAITN